MRHRDPGNSEGVRRGLVLTTVLSALLGASLFAGIGIVPKKSLVKVTVKSESEGISIHQSYVAQTKVQELIELTGVIAAEGYVLAFSGGHLPMFTASGIDFTFSVQTFDGKGYPASLAGFDERLSMIYLRAPVSSDLAINFSPDSIQNNFKLAVLDNNQWKIAEPCARDRKELSFVPVVEFKLGELDSNVSWSGAAVIDFKGRLLGVVASAWPHPYSSDTISEVIPVELLRASFDTVRKTGENTRVGWVGVYLDDNKKRTEVHDIIPDAPAQKAGLRSKDVIVALDGESVGDLHEFIRAVRSRTPGTAVRLTVERDGKRQIIPLELGARPEMKRLGWKMEVPGMMGGVDKSEGFKLYRSQLPPLVDQGLVVDSIPPQLASKLKSPIDGGLLVKEVRATSAGQKAGFQAGDVIFQINGKDVRTLTEAQEILEAAPKGLAEIQLVRDGRVKLLKIAFQ